jgi:uncharacterized membrane protein YcjF (UPF0283 family)
MAKENIEEFSLEGLLKRKKLLVAVLVILTIAFVLDCAMLIVNLLAGKGFCVYLFVPAMACGVFALLMYAGLNSINKELAKRKNE